MNTQDDILEELRNWNSPLANMPRHMPFDVPKGYFESVYEGVLAGIREDDEHTLPLQLKHMPYELPQGYFENLPDAMLGLVKGVELTADIPKATPFTAPEGYFDSLPLQMLNAAKEANPVHVKKPQTITMGRTIWSKVRMAAAAVLLIAVGFGGYRMLNAETTLTTEQQLAQLPKETIQAYVQQNIDDFDMDMIAGDLSTEAEKAYEEEISNYLDSEDWEEEDLIN